MASEERFVEVFSDQSIPDGDDEAQNPTEEDISRLAAALQRYSVTPLLDELPPTELLDEYRGVLRRRLTKSEFGRLWDIIGT